MFRCSKLPRVIAGAALLSTLMPGHATAHGFAGSRFFPATLATDDPFVADELALPTISSFKDADGLRTTTYSADFAKRLTANFGLEFGASYIHLSAPGEPTESGFDNVSLGAKYQFLLDAQHETILSFGLDADIGGTGQERVGAADFTTISPTLFFGKGFGDLFDTTSYLRPLALTGTLGLAIPTQARSSDGMGGFEEHPNSVELGLALEYSLPYLQAQVRNIGLGGPFDRMIPLVEFSLETPIDRGGGKSAATFYPGLLWAGQYIQLGAEAIIPLNDEAGHGAGFISQLHFYIDDVFPQSLGRPWFGRQ